ncbi:putative nucleic acid-binding Zn ribbon protein [Ochrobactrum daejeonense]|uniref:Putative nucleic acid-binding Zn ribbon protein n=1 Tax=Brucella daejeonensis TaxID=659015 RepID=A0A7W9AY02_9HYPH|nr:hypothetical protein [Brucella daejeonensis]MBB5702699.1 putative nucleic acid-binding Zn ribbon protein [Brucella daejeonensis]
MAKRGKAGDFGFHVDVRAGSVPIVGDLFDAAGLGQKPVIKTRLEFSEPTACGHCGQLFAAIAGNGRPIRFCSEPCREAHRLFQQKSWNQKPSSEQPKSCQGCGKPFPPRKVSAGRFRRFCSPNCRVNSRRAEIRQRAVSQQTGFWPKDFSSVRLPSGKTSRSLCALSGDLADGRISPAILPNGEADG